MAKRYHFLLTTLLAATISGSAFAQAANNNALTPNQIKQVKEVVHSYLIENPKVLVEASEALQKQAVAKAEAKAKSAIGKYSKEIFNDPHSPVIGNTKGKVTLVEFLDYQCGHCRQMETIINNLIKTDKNLKVVIKQLPIFGNSSEYAARIALAAYKQNPKAFSTLHNALFKTPTPLTKEKVMRAAKKAGYNTNNLGRIADSTTIKQQVKDNFSLAQNLGLIGTPAFIVGDHNGNKNAFVPGATSEQNLQSLIKKVS